jgi:hypothetical protein
MRTRTVGIIVGIGVAVAGGGLAFAYFTNIGSGSGNAGTGSNNPVVVKQTSTVAAMAPGVAPQLLFGNFDNEANPGPVYIASVTAVVTLVTPVVPSPAPSPAPPACVLSDFVIGTGTTAGTTQTGITTDVRATSGGAVTNGAEIPAGAAQGAWSGLNLQFNNKTTNQDACKNSTVTITYTAK